MCRATILARPPRYRSRQCKFPTRPTRFQLSYRIQRDPRLYIIHSYFHATAGFYRETRYSFRIPSGEQLACSPWFFSVCFSSRYALPSWSPGSTIFCSHGKRRLRKILSTGVRRCLRQRNYSCTSLFLSFSLSLLFGKHRVLCKQLRRLCRAYLNCRHKQLVRFLRIL